MPTSEVKAGAHDTKARPIRRIGSMVLERGKIKYKNNGRENKGVTIFNKGPEDLKVRYRDFGIRRSGMLTKMCALNTKVSIIQQ
jgi:hypothetical protein